MSRLIHWVSAQMAGIVFAVAGPALGDTLLVPEDLSTIQAALDVAVSGDVVSVAPGVYNENVSFQSHGVTLLSRALHAATIDGGGSGHVVVANTFTATVDGFVITGSGGGFRAGVFTSQASQVIRNNIITGNDGRGVVISSGSIARINNNIITNNGSFNEGIECVTGGSAIVVNNYIANNHKGVQGSSAGDMTVINNTIVDNTFVNLSFLDTNAVITNNLLANSQFGIIFVGPFDPDITSLVATFLTISYNDVWGHSEHDYFAELGGIPDFISGVFAPLPGTGEISADPLLTGGGGYRLGLASPAIDAGDNNAVPLFASTDLDGNPRFADDPATLDTGNGTAPIVDMGVHEIQFQQAIPTLSVPGLVVLVASLLSMIFVVLSWARIRTGSA